MPPVPTFRRARQPRALFVGIRILARLEMYAKTQANVVDAIEAIATSGARCIRVFDVVVVAASGKA